MKKYILLSVKIFILSSLLYSQSNFKSEEFLKYREQIRSMTTDEILQKYPPQNIYYSTRENKIPLEYFQYLDSIEQRFSLTDYEKQLISDNHFMVSERISYSSFADAFVNIYSSDLPLFLSSDFFLHALHVSYDIMLRDLEAGVLEINLLNLLSSMRDEISIVYNSYTGNIKLLQAVKDVDLFLSIALSLLEDKEIKPLYDDSGNYPVLMNAVNTGQPSVLDLGLFSTHTRKLDISQFTPRGHYTDLFWWNGEYRDLKNYFKAMTWLGRIDFMLTPPPVAPGEPEWPIEDLKRMSRGSIIINKLLDVSGKKDLLELHEQIIGFFVGPDDNLNPSELENILHDIALDPEELSNDLRWNLFQKKLNESDDYGQKIMSNFFIVDADKENPAELPISYRLLGQKFLIDSYIFSEVVYDRVYHEGQEVFRMMPDPLDAMFVLGNEDALALLEDDLNTYHYGYKLEELRYLTDSYDPEFWNQSLYNSWLDAIRELNPPADRSGFPYFMQTTEWQLEKLNTQLSSWAELRHDNVLYAKQSYTGGTSCSFPYVYIEPYPALYQKLADFSSSASDFFVHELEGLNFLKKDQVIAFWNKFGEHMKKLKTLAQKELNRETFNENDLVYLKTFINGAMASGPSITGWYNELFYDPFKGMEADQLVVDVHTQPTDEFGNEVGKVLHVGTGNINLGVFCAGSPCNEYESAAFIGPVISFHVKVEENWNRLNDDDWSDLFWDYPDQPDRPDWVNNYLADAQGSRRGSGKDRNLEGYTFRGTSANSPYLIKDIAYFLAFPNPANNYTSLRFIINRPAFVSADIYDVMGRKIRGIFAENLIAGEHNMDFDLQRMNSGLYFLQLKTNSDQQTIRLVVK